MNKVSNISHLILSGGGAKGLVYFGILRYLYFEGMIDKIKYIKGTSIGAYFAIIFALKIPSEFIETEFSKIQENLHTHISCNKSTISNLFLHNGVLTLDFLLKPIKDYVHTKYEVDDLSFIEFVKKTGVNIYIRCRNINNSQVQYFSMEETPDISVFDALRASMSLPFIFQPVNIGGHYYMDAMISDFNFFKDADPSNIICVKLPADAKSEPLPPGTHMDLFQYSQRVTQIMLDIISNDEGQTNPDIFCIGPLTYDKFFKFKFTDKDAYVEVTQEEFDDMIVQGFVYMHQYMNKRFRLKD